MFAYLSIYSFRCGARYWNFRSDMHELQPRFAHTGGSPWLTPDILRTVHPTVCETDHSEETIKECGVNEKARTETLNEDYV